jgi:GTP-binding protein HflX
VMISAVTGAGIDTLLTAIGDRLRAMANVVELVIPYDRGDVVAAVHREGEVLVESHEADATRLRARLDPADASRYREFLVS